MPYVTLVASDEMPAVLKKDTRSSPLRRGSNMEDITWRANSLINIQRSVMPRDTHSHKKLKRMAKLRLSVGVTKVILSKQL